MLVTGSATGIGRAAAVRFAREGRAVAVNYSRSEAEAKETVAGSVQGHGDRPTRAGGRGGRRGGAGHGGAVPAGAGRTRRAGQQRRPRPTSSTTPTWTP